MFNRYKFQDRLFPTAVILLAGSAFGQTYSPMYAPNSSTFSAWQCVYDGTTTAVPDSTIYCRARLLLEHQCPLSQRKETKIFYSMHDGLFVLLLIGQSGLCKRRWGVQLLSERYAGRAGRGLDHHMPRYQHRSGFKPKYGLCHWL